MQNTHSRPVLTYGQFSLITGSFLLALAVVSGAFGAHGLEGKLDARLIETYQTGVTYHFYHAFGLLFVGVLEHLFQKSFKFTRIFFLLGIILFSGNCYLYALSGVRNFALIVPLGGVAYILGWVSLGFNLLGMRPKSS